MDGDFSGEAVQDMGAYEFSHVGLEVTGDPLPGAVLTVELTGTAGLTAEVLVGSVPSEVCTADGPVFLDPSSASTLPATTLPDTLNYQIPAGVETLIFQAIARSGGLGNTSRPVVLTLEFSAEIFSDGFESGSTSAWTSP